MSDDAKDKMTTREILRNPHLWDPAIKKAYFDRDTHPGHSSPTERARHQRHVDAVKLVSDLYNQAAKEPQAPPAEQIQADHRQGVREKIDELRQDAEFQKVYRDRNHDGHQDA